MPGLSPSDRDRRVLMVVSVLARGGCERQLHATTRGLLERGYEIEIFTLAEVPAGELSLEAEFRKLGIRITCAGAFGDMSRGNARDTGLYRLGPFAPILPHLDVSRLGWALGQVITRFRPGVVHCWSEVSCVIGGFVATALAVPRTILQFVSVPPPRQKPDGSELYRKAYRALARRRNVRMLNISFANALSFEDWLNLPRGTVGLLRNGFVPDSLLIRDEQQAKSIRRALGIADGTLTVGSIMRFAPEKDPDLWLDTASLIAAAKPDVHFILAGYGALAGRIEARIKDMDLSERFTLPGPTTDAGAAYAYMDVFLMTSKFEGTPNALVEAQAAGVPVVAPSVGGIEETMRDGLTGVLSAERTAPQIAEAVLRILADPGWRRRAAENGPRFVAERFDWQRKIDNTIALYRLDESRLYRGIERVKAILGAWRQVGRLQKCGAE